MAQRCWLGLVILIAWVPAAPAQVRLQWKFRPGETFYLETTQETKTTVKHQGRPVVQEVQYVMVSGFQVVRADPSGIVLTQKVESVKPKLDGPGAAEAAKLLQMLEGAVYTITLDARLQVAKIDGYEAVLAKLAGDNPKLRKLVASRINPETLAQDIGALFGLFLPEREVTAGATWKREAAYGLGPWGRFVGVAEYTLAAQRPLPAQGRNGEQVTVVWAMRYETPKKGADTDIAPVTQGDLKLDLARGTYVFDTVTGKLVSFDRSLAFHGSLTLHNTESELTIELEQSITSRNRFSERNPVAK